jgi:hypothetical protein
MRDGTDAACVIGYRLGTADNLYATVQDVQHRHNCYQISQGIYWVT